jgi:hypothetical protein
METAIATPPLTDVDQSKIQKVINNSGEDIVVCMSLTSSDIEHSNPVVSYNKDYVILQTPNGTVIKNGETGSVTLDRTFMNKGTERQEPDFTLLISNTTWLTPVAKFHVRPNRDPVTKVMSYDPVTVTSDAITGLKQAGAFYQTIAAYPETKLAKDYVEALNLSSQTGSLDDINYFFQNTASYKQVTQDGLMFVENCYKLFPFVWAGYVNSATYYLYSSDGKVTSFQGMLTLNKTGDIDITRANGGYTCQFLPALTPADTSVTDVDPSKAIKLTYVDGIFTDDPDSDVPNIAIMGSFQLKRTFTKDPADTKIMAIMAGSINARTAVGFDEAQLSDPDDPTQDWLNSLFHPKTAEGIFNSIMQILGALMMLHFVGNSLYEFGNWIKEKIWSKEPYTDAELQAEKLRIETELNARSTNNFKKVAGEQASLPETPLDAWNVASTAKGRLSNGVSAGRQLDSLSKLDKILELLEKYAEFDRTGQLKNQVDEAQADTDDGVYKLNDATDSNRGDTVAELGPKITDLMDAVVKLNVSIELLVSVSAKQVIQDNLQRAKAAEKQADDETRAREEEAAERTSTDPKPEEFVG